MRISDLRRWHITVLILTSISVVFIPYSWAVYGAPIIGLKRAERFERAGNYLAAAADREYVADFSEFVSIPQFEDDMEYFLAIGDEDRANFCRNTISGFRRSIELCRKMADKNRTKGKLTAEQIEKYRERNLERMLAGAEIYPIMHNGQMGIDVKALEKNGGLAEDFEKAAQGRERTARLYEKITAAWVLHQAEIFEEGAETKLATEYREKAEVYKQKAASHYRQAAENRKKAEELRRFEDAEYAVNALEDDDLSIQKLALRKLIRDTNYPGIARAAKSDSPDISKMARDALEDNKELIGAAKVDQLVLALGSSNAGIRKIAIEELEKLAGTRLGYSDDAPESDRNIALEQWNDWLLSKLEEGLIGVYYKGKDFDKEILSRTDKVIDFEWDESPHTDLPKDRFSVRWVGKIRIPKTGKYTLSIEADDGAKVWIGKMPRLEQIVSNWTEYSYAGHQEEVHLEEGFHDVKIEYFENNKGANMKLYWDSNDMKKHVIPKENLYHVSFDGNNK